MRMRSLLSCKVCRGVCAVVLLSGIGGKGADVGYVVPEGPMLPNTVLISQMMRELSATPGFTETLLAQIDRDGKQGPALMTPALINRLRELILGKDWQGLDRFPGWTMQAINPTVKVVSKVVARNEAVADLAARNPGAPTGSVSTEQMKAYVDLGSYSLEKAETVTLDEPASLPAFTTEGLISDLGAGVLRGDHANPNLAPMHPRSHR